MPNDDKSLLATVRRLQKAVTRKVSRIHTHFGVQMSGSSEDPRIPAASRNSLSESGLREYSHNLADFLRRDVQFVPDSQRRPMPRAEWERYKKLETQWNAKVREYTADIKKLHLPSTNMTIEETQATFGLSPRSRAINNPSVNQPSEIERASTGVAGKAGLRRLIESMQKRLQPEYFDEEHESNKETFRKMFDVIQDDELSALIESLTPGQFDILWNWTPFVLASAYWYEVMQRALQGGPPPSAAQEHVQGQLLGDMIREARRNAEWAQTLNF